MIYDQWVHGVDISCQLLLEKGFNSSTSDSALPVATSPAMRVAESAAALLLRLVSQPDAFMAELMDSRLQFGPYAERAVA